MFHSGRLEWQKEKPKNCFCFLSLPFTYQSNTLFLDTFAICRDVDRRLLRAIYFFTNLFKVHLKRCVKHENGQYMGSQTTSHFV